MGSVTSRADEKLTAFLELEAAIRAGSAYSDGKASYGEFGLLCEAQKWQNSGVEPGDSTGSKASRAISQSVPGPFYLRYYPDHRLMAWQPQGTLDDLMLDQIAEWLVYIEKAFLPFKRFVDLSQLTTVAVRTGHVFKVARRRAEQFRGVEPVRTALFSEDWVAFGIAHLYASLMEDTLIEARAFRDLAKAAEWLAIPIDVLTLKDEPVPHIGPMARKSS